MVHVYLDDLRRCPKGFILARNAAECMLLLDEYEIDILSLDHDLGHGEPTGYDVVKYMVEHGKFAKHIYLHTSSAIGRSNMYQMLYRYKPEGVSLHAAPMPDEILERVSREHDQA